MSTTPVTTQSDCSTAETLPGRPGKLVAPSPDALRIAAACGADPRTAERAIRFGAGAIRVRSVRYAIERAAAEIGVPLPPGAK